MTESVSLSPPPAPHAEPTPGSLRPHRLDILLAGLVLAFAFLTASFAARNSDFFLHLATGRLLARGEYTFGVDPFSYTTNGVYWANHAWLFDLALYAGFTTLGGAGLVVLKALVVTLLAGLMLWTGGGKERPPHPQPLSPEAGARGARQEPPHPLSPEAGARGERGGTFWISGFCTLLAVLAMSPRLLLQSTCLSLLLLALCLWLLHAGGRALLALPLVIALWVNLDAWFLLGPLLVVLFGLGERLTPRAEGKRLPLWLPFACLAAGLLSPHHVHAFTLPAELSPGVWASDLRHDVRFASLFASPWRLTPLGHAGGYNLSAWAFFILLFLGGTSFAVNRSALRGWRLPVWLAFALLAAWQARLIPFFAVLAGPITALNLREVLPSRALIRIGRSVLMLACLVLMALNWPGWLQGFHRRDRALAWAIHTDPSLHRVAETLAHWREEGILHADVRTFAFHPDVAHYCAWFCPAEKGFLDSRLPIFVPVASDYEDVCLALDPDLRSPSHGEIPSASRWQKILDEHNIACVVLYDPDVRRLAPALREVTLSSPPWDLLQVDGKGLVVGWRGARSTLSKALRFDSQRAAFGPPDEVLPLAPGKGPPELAQPRPWWRLFLDQPSESSWEAETSKIYLRLFEDSAALQQQRQREQVLARHAVGLVGLPALSAGLAPSVALASRLLLERVFLPDLQTRPAALPFLTVRAARRGIAEQPGDAGAWLVLAQAYLSLERTTAEAAPYAVLPPLAHLRHVQTVTALVQAVALQPDLAIAHERLAVLFAERRFLDLALLHRSTQLRLVRQAGPQPREDLEAFNDRIRGLEQVVAKMERAVQDGENRVAVHSRSLAGKPLVRARLSLQLGLAGKAIDEILRSRPELYGMAGIRFLLDLLLLTGRAQDAGELLDRPELLANPAILGDYDLPGDGRHWGYRFLAFDWFILCQTASVGHYDRAGAALERLRGQRKQRGDTIRAWLTPRLAQVRTSELGLGAVPAAIGLRSAMGLMREDTERILLQNRFLPIDQGDLHVLEAILLLERGEASRAGEQFRHALSLYQPMAASTSALPGRPLAIHYLERIR